MNAQFIEFDHGITAVDSFFIRPGLAAIHLMEEQDQTAIIDTGTNYSLPYLQQVMSRRDIAPESVRYVIVTHVHLDHAGAAGRMMQLFPNARLVVHPRGARHMIDPSKLVAGASAVYGEQVVRETYGEIVPVAADRVIEASDNVTLDLAGRTLQFLDTPGHARHHFCVWDETSRSIFTGDTFGISYREFDVNGREFIFPTCTPVQFEPEAAHASIDRLMALDPVHVFLTHYSRISQFQRLAGDLHRMLEQFVELGLRCRSLGAARHEALKHGLEQIMIKALRAHGCTLTDDRITNLVAMDYELNAQGIAVWLDRGD